MLVYDWKMVNTVGRATNNELTGTIYFNNDFIFTTTIILRVMAVVVVWAATIQVANLPNWNYPNGCLHKVSEGTSTTTTRTQHAS